MLSEEPLKLFAIATRCEWREEMILAARQSLTISIHDPQHEKVLERVPSRALIKLINFHHSRRVSFRRFINDSDRFTSGNTPGLSCWDCSSAVDPEPWRLFKAKMTAEIERRPMGDTVLSVGHEEWPEASEVWDQQCSECPKRIYNRTLTIANIVQCVQDLPQDIDL